MKCIRQATLTALIVATFGCVSSPRPAIEDYEEPPLGSEIYDSEYLPRDM